MDHPKKQISPLILALTTGSPSTQKKALETYFLPNASFTHPLCRVPSFSSFHLPLIGEINSRWVIWMIYRWYKILSPRISLEVECAEYNQEQQILFTQIHQLFTLFFLPFYTSNVHLTTTLHLHLSSADGKYYIQHQEDLYQSSEVVKFFWPGGTWVVFGWQVFASVVCILGALVLAPVTWAEERWHGKVQMRNGVKGGRKGL